MTLTVAVYHPCDSRPGNPAFQSLIDRLNAQIAESVRQLGWVPVFITGDTLAPGDQLPHADMVIIAGGEDVDPTLYGASACYPGAGHHVPAADRVQCRVIRESVATSTPVLGICRGLQLINVALGGTLVRDMGSDPTFPGGNHRNESSGVSGTAGAPFVPTVVTGSPGTTGIVPDGPVLCTHHQAVGRLAPGLSVVARSIDGVIEAVVHESAPVTGVQWHPEHPAVAAEQLTALLLRLETQLRAGTAADVSAARAMVTHAGGSGSPTS